MKKFYGLDKRIYNAFYGNFRNLRKAQIAAIDPILSGKDLILTAGTGSGKTEAAVAPLLSKYWRYAISDDCLVLLYIAPTKALVNDLQKRLQSKLQVLNLRVGIRHGDQDDLKKSNLPHILITTPESLDVLIFRRDEYLKTIRAIVVDEVHLLYNTQRGLQLSILLKRLEMFINMQSQIVALSATINDLNDVSKFLLPDRKNTIYLQYPSDRTIDAFIEVITNENDFLVLIKKLLNRSVAKLLIFVNSRKECERLANTLKNDPKLKSSVFTHYSSLSANLRLAIEKKFSENKKAICISTSTLELGIDIGDINAVILWGSTDTVESFLQRIGRGNRRESKTNVICLVPPNLESSNIEMLKYMTLIDCAKKGHLSSKLPFQLYGAICQQLLSIIAMNGGAYIKISELFAVVSHLPYLNRENIEDILSELASKEYTQHHGFKNRYGGNEKLYLLQDYRLIYGNFGLGSQMIPIKHSTKNLGEVPSINLLRIKPGKKVRFAGRTWRIKKTSSEAIELEPSSKDNKVIDFIYPGTKIGMETYIANKIWKQIHSGEISKSLFQLSTYNKILNYIEYIKNNCSYNQIPSILNNGRITYYTFAGYFVNKAIALLTEQIEYIASDLSLTVSFKINWQSIPHEPIEYKHIFHNLFESRNEQSIYQRMLSNELQVSEFLQDWLYDKAINDTLERLVHSESIEIKKDIFI